MCWLLLVRNLYAYFFIILISLIDMYAFKKFVTKWKVSVRAYMALCTELYTGYEKQMNLQTLIGLIFTVTESTMAYKFNLNR